MSVASLIRAGLGSTPADLVRLGLGSGAAPSSAAGPIITLGLLYTPADVLRLGLGAGGAGPTAPTGLSATVTGSTTATLSWVDASSDETGFTVQVDSGGGFVNASGATNPTAAGATSFTATGLAPATSYAWRVGATNGSGTSYTTGTSFTTDNPGSGGGTVPVYGEVSGAAATGAAGTITATGTAVAAITGVAGTGLAGIIAAVVAGQAAITGAAASGLAGTITASGTSAGGGTVSPAAVWGYVMSNGQTAEANLLALLALLQGVNVVQIVGQGITGTGTEADPWGPAP